MGDIIVNADVGGDISVVETWMNAGTPGQNGAAGRNGTSIESMTTEFYKSSSATDLRDGTWSTQIPDWSNNTWVWVKWTFEWSDTQYRTWTSEAGPFNLTGHIGPQGPPGENGKPGGSRPVFFAELTSGNTIVGSFTPEDAEYAQNLVEKSQEFDMILTAGAVSKSTSSNVTASVSFGGTDPEFYPIRVLGETTVPLVPSEAGFINLADGLFSGTCIIENDLFVITNIMGVDGILPISKGGTGSQTAMQACQNLTAVSWSDGFDIPENSDIHQIAAVGGNHTCLTADSAKTITNAPWNDSSFKLIVGETVAGTGRARFLLAVSAHHKEVIKMCYCTDYLDEDTWSDWTSLVAIMTEGVEGRNGVGHPDGTTIGADEAGMFYVHPDLMERIEILEFDVARKAYVASFGDDENPGTFSKPVRTLQRAYEICRDGWSIMIINNSLTIGESIEFSTLDNPKNLSIIAVDVLGQETKNIINIVVPDGATVSHQYADLTLKYVRFISATLNTSVPTLIAKNGRLNLYGLSGATYLLVESESLNAYLDNETYPNHYPRYETATPNNWFRKMEINNVYFEDFYLYYTGGVDVVFTGDLTTRNVWSLDYVSLTAKAGTTVKVSSSSSSSYGTLIGKNLIEKGAVVTGARAIRSSAALQGELELYGTFDAVGSSGGAILYTGYIDARDDSNLDLRFVQNSNYAAIKCGVDWNSTGVFNKIAVSTSSTRSKVATFNISSGEVPVLMLGHDEDASISGGVLGDCRFAGMANIDGSAQIERIATNGGYGSNENNEINIVSGIVNRVCYDSTSSLVGTNASRPKILLNGSASIGSVGFIRSSSLDMRGKLRVFYLTSKLQNGFPIESYSGGLGTVLEPSGVSGKVIEGYNGYQITQEDVDVLSESAVEGVTYYLEDNAIYAVWPDEPVIFEKSPYDNAGAGTRPRYVYSIDGFNYSVTSGTVARYTARPGNAGNASGAGNYIVVGYSAFRYVDTSGMTFSFGDDTSGTTNEATSDSRSFGTIDFAASVISASGSEVLTISPTGSGTDNITINISWSNVILGTS